MSNNFEELYKDEEPSEEVKKKVMGSQRQIRHIASYFELFLGNFFKSISGLIELTEKNTNQKHEESETDSTHK